MICGSGSQDVRLDMEDCNKYPCLQQQVSMPATSIHTYETKCSKHIRTRNRNGLLQAPSTLATPRLHQPCPSLEPYNPLDLAPTRCIRTCTSALEASRSRAHSRCPPPTAWSRGVSWSLSRTLTSACARIHTYRLRFPHHSNLTPHPSPLTPHPSPLTPHPSSLTLNLCVEQDLNTIKHPLHRRRLKRCHA